MKYRLLILVCGTVLSLVADTFASATPRKVGVVLPLSGALAEYGVATMNGIKLAPTSSRPVLEFLWEDSHSETKYAVTAYEKLAADGAELVVVWGTTANEGVAPVAQKRGIPILAVSRSASITMDRPQVIRTVQDADHLISPLARHLLAKDVRTITIFKTEWSYTEEQSLALRKALPRVKIVEVPFQRSDLEFKSHLLRLKQNKPDAIGVLLGPAQISVFFRQAEQLGISGRFFGTSMFASEREIRDSGPLINGAVFADIDTCDSFNDLYLKQYGIDTHVTYALNARDMAAILQSITTKLKEGESLSKSLEQVKGFQAACSSLSFKESLEVGKYFDYPDSLYVIQDGKVRPVTE